MRIHSSRIILGIIALIVNVSILSVFVTNLPLGVIPSHREVLEALAPLDIIFVILIVFAGKEYEEQS